MGYIEDILFTNEECKSILSLATNWKDSLASPAYANLYSSKTDNVRKSSDSNPNRDELSHLILDKLSKYDIISIPDIPKILKYKKGCFFVKHTDRESMDSIRKKTLIIQLSKQSHYQGGELIINDVKCSKSIGNTIIMDSNEVHEVKEIIEGTRYALIMWLESKNLKENSNLI